LMCFEMEGSQSHSRENEEEHECENEDEEKLGPVIICVDTSGSMQGSPETVAKAVTLFMATRAVSQKRNCFLINFSTKIETMDLSGRIGITKVIEFLQRSFHGGTDVSPALTHALKIMENKKYIRSDLIVISDFLMASVPESLQDMIRLAKEKGNRFYSLSIGDIFLDERLEALFDNEWVYNPSDSSIRSVQVIASAMERQSTG
ncbi:MAG: VWA domain-containing protein, partial [Gemmatimonadetes bacterium]|nr:VWA domain-containing protein [Gemmatimonadota bacterium]